MVSRGRPRTLAINAIKLDSADDIPSVRAENIAGRADYIKKMIESKYENLRVITDKQCITIKRGYLEECVNISVDDATIMRICERLINARAI